MELTNDFVIERNIEETWKILNDLEFIAPCMPGAQLTEIEGDEYRGLVKIKVGPISANYKGKASFVEQDAVNHVARLKAEGRDPRQGNANAMVTATMEELAAEQTKVTIHTDLGLTGKIASFGRGAIEDVSKKILGQFTDNLRDKLATDGGSSASSDSSSVTDASIGDATAATASSSSASPSVSSAPATSSSPAASSSPTGSASTTPSPGVRKIDSPEAEAVDLLDVAGGAAAKRFVPAAGGAAILAAIIWWVINR